MYKIVTIDLDGTLLNSRGEISENNIKILRKCIDKGIEIVLTSGRITSSILNFANLIGGTNYLIAGNGSCIYDINNKEVLYQNSLPKEKVLEIIKICEENSMYYSAYGEKSILTKSYNHSILFYAKENLNKVNKEKININITEDIFSYVKNSDNPKISKITISDNDKIVFTSMVKKLKNISHVDVLDVAHISRKIIENGTELVPIEFYYSEVMNENVNKWSAIERLIKKLDIKQEEVISIGDNLNDKEMLENAGLGIAMGQAAPYIKEFADFITETNENDGVGKALQKYVLEEI